MEHTPQWVFDIIESIDRISEQLSRIEKRMDDNDNNTYVTLTKAAELLGVHYNTCLRYVDSGKLPAQQSDYRGEYRISLSDINEFKSKTHEPRKS